MAKPASSRLEPIDLDWDLEREIPEEVSHVVGIADQMLQGYWDQWHRRPIEQYVACDFRDVWRALAAVTQSSLADGNTFLEWGSGFGVVTGLAAQLGWDAVGIEAESFLVDQSKEFLRNIDQTAQVVCGNFLPLGAERLARNQANHASLFHHVPSAYESLDLQCDDFALVFAYPWPGEHHFLQEVFRVYARDQALLLLFLGPYEIELYRKTLN
jgi:SAM-dependent methyltransferase